MSHMSAEGWLHHFKNAVSQSVPRVCRYIGGDLTPNIGTFSKYVPPSPRFTSSPDYMLISLKCG